MVRILAAVTIAAGVLASATIARADTPAEALTNGKVVVSADRLFTPIDYFSASANSNGTKATASEAELGLFAGGVLGAQNDPFTMPRVGLDILPTSHLTLGLSAWVLTQVSSSLSVTPATGTAPPSQDQPKATFWGIAPRVGYILPFGDTLSVWPRIGLDYASLSTSTESNNGVQSGGVSLSLLDLSLETLLVVTPWNHVGLTLGPFGEIPLTGSFKATSNGTSIDESAWVLGLTAGVLLSF